MGGGGGWRQEGTILIPIAIAGLISTLIRGKKRLLLGAYKRGARQCCSSSKGRRYGGRLISKRTPYNSVTLYYVEVKIFCYSTFLEGSSGNIQRWLDHSGRVASYIHPRDSAILFKIQLLIKRRWRVVKGKRGELLKFIIFAGFSSRLQLISKLCPSV